MRSLRLASAVLLLGVGVATWFALFDDNEWHAAASDAERVSAVEAVDTTEQRIVVDDTARPAEAEPVQEVVSLASALEPALASNRLFGVVHPAIGVETLRGDIHIQAIDRLGGEQHAQASPDGAYWIAGLAPGMHWLRAGSREDGWVRARVEIPSPPTDVRLDLQLVPELQLRISVLDADGYPIEDFWSVPIATLNPPGDWYDEINGSLNNPFGVGRFREAQAKPSRVDVAHGGTLVLDVEPPLFVSLVHGQRVVAAQRVEPGQQEVVFVLDRDSPLLKPGSLRFHFVDAATNAPLAVKMAQLEGRGSRMMQSTDGAYYVSRTPPGEYEILAMLEGYERGRRRVRVEAGVENDYGAIALERALWVAGRVVDENGAGLDCHLRTSLFDPDTGRMLDGYVTWEFPCDAQRGFRISHVSRAVYAVRLVDQGPYADACRIVDLRNGSVENVELVAHRGVPLVVHPSSTQWPGMRFEIRDASNVCIKSTRFWTDAPRPILLAPGAYTVAVISGDVAQPTGVPVTIGSEPVELALP